MHQKEDLVESLGCLFDCSFTRFITPRIIRLLYVLGIVFVGIILIVMIIGAFAKSLALGVVMLILIGPLYFLVAVLKIRVFLELIMIIFRIEENTARMSGREVAHATTQQTSVPPPIGESEGPQTTPPSI